MRIPSIYTRSTERADVAMTPMIDVVFLLLIFFVWTASFHAIEVLLPSQLTASTEAGNTDDLPAEDFERIVVRLQMEAGRVRWQLNGQAVSALTRLRDRLAQLAAIRAELPVVVDPDLDVAFGDVIDVYDVARDAGLANIQFTTRG